MVPGMVTGVPLYGVDACELFVNINNTRLMLRQVDLYARKNGLVFDDDKDTLDMGVRLYIASPLFLKI